MSSSLWDVEPVKPQLFFPGSKPPEPPSLLSLPALTKLNLKLQNSKRVDNLPSTSLSQSTSTEDTYVPASSKRSGSKSVVASSSRSGSKDIVALQKPNLVERLPPLPKPINAKPKLKALRKLLSLKSPKSQKGGSLNLVPSSQTSRRNGQFDNHISQSLGSPVYSPSDLPPRQADFDYSSFKIGDVVLVDRTEIGDGLRKATIIYVNKEYSPEDEYFHGHLVVLKPSAKERSRHAEGKRTVYYVHYAGLDRRMDEWIDVHEIHSPVETAQTPSFSQLGSTLLLSDLNDPPTKKTRSQKKKAEEFQHNEKASIDYGATLARCEENHEKATMLKNVDSIQIGQNVVRCWYFSPYPADVITGRHLYICENCLMYFSSRPFFQMHIGRCQPAPPPGELIYFDKENSFAVYEVIGAEHRFYCESLCLLSKLFLDHKTLYYQVDTFYFYVICEIEENGTHHLVGHFSKENYSMNNLACILVLPPYQRKGYGKFLIQLSYAFSCREGFIGTPEKPLSDLDLGKVSYRGFWWWLLINALIEGGYEDDINVLELERITGVAADDIISTFAPMEFVKKYKGEMCISMSPTILKFCKSLPLFTGPKLLIDCDLIKWTERYLPVEEAGIGHKEVVQKEIIQQDIMEQVEEKVIIETIPATTNPVSQTFEANEVQDVEMEVDEVAVEDEENNMDEEEFEDEDDEYEDFDDDDEFFESSDHVDTEEEEPDIDEDENIDDLGD
uniref:Histone acetyltransferase n=1 Tax=Panagrolaimus sp. ES5 TaxID=591445 RepID=A0AC34FN15_9BILA